MCFISFASWAYDIEIDGIYYNLNAIDKTAEIVKNPDRYKGDIIIPSSIYYNGMELPVTSIGSFAFSVSEINTLVLPNSITNISSYAFSSSYLNEITLGTGLRTIADYAFRECKLKSIKIPGTVEYIGCRAFEKCENLEIVDIGYGDDVTEKGITIGDRAFRSSGVKEVFIGRNVKYAEEVPFQNDYKIKKVHIEDLSSWCDNSLGDFDLFSYGEAILLVNGEVITSLVVPENIKEIRQHSFAGCSSITSIKLTENIEKVGSYAFYGCKNLTHVTLENVKSIESLAFAYCTGLSNVISKTSTPPVAYNDSFKEAERLNSTLFVPKESINDYKQAIGWNSFWNIEALMTAEEADSAATAEANKFKTGNADILNKTTDNVKYSDLGAIKKALEDYSKLSDAAKEKVTKEKDLLDSLKKKVESFVIASGTCGSYGDNLTWTLSEDYTLIIEGQGYMDSYSYDSYAPWYSYHSMISKLILPEGLTNIGKYAFIDCSNICSITIPNSVEYISDYAFRNCSSLTSVDIPDKVTTIGRSTFDNCTSLTSVTIGNGVTSIGWFAFAFCPTLSSLKIGSSVQSIGKSAFADCYSLTSITIPNSVTSIGEHAFGWCFGLPSVTIPSSVTSIGKDIFYGCYFLEKNFVTNSSHISLDNCGATIIDIEQSDGLCIKDNVVVRSRPWATSAIIPASIESIKGVPFDNCYNLASITVEKGNKIYDSRDNCNAIIETSNNSLVAGCKNTVIPNTVKSIGENAFEHCINLTSIDIPNSVTSIDSWAFFGCSGLISIRIPNSVTSVGYRSFVGCSALKTIYIGSGIRKIDITAFSGCHSLETVTCAATSVPDTRSDAFDDSNVSNATLMVPKASLQAYKSKVPWSEFGTILAIADEPTTDEKQEPIDLGLSVCWASMNLGSNSSADIGDYNFWDTSAPSEYWGDGWRMPTRAEMQELINNCIWTKTTEGYKIKGPNGNEIFLPITGFRMDGASKTYSSSYLFYWTSTQSDGMSYALCDQSGVSCNTVYDTEWTKMAIRPVCTKTTTGSHSGNLGLSVEWSLTNFNASSVGESGMIGPQRLANLNLTDGWRLPTKDEIQELIDNCSWTTTTLNGYSVFKVTAPNGNYIYFPKTGYMPSAGMDGSLVNSNYGYYWTSTSTGSNYYILKIQSASNVQVSTLSDSYSAAIRSVKAVATGIHNQESDMETKLINVYSIYGSVLKRKVLKSEALQNLKSGLYIVDGKKVLKKQ